MIEVSLSNGLILEGIRMDINTMDVIMGDSLIPAESYVPLKFDSGEAGRVRKKEIISYIETA